VTIKVHKQQFPALFRDCKLNHGRPGARMMNGLFTPNLNNRQETALRSSWNGAIELIYFSAEDFGHFEIMGKFGLSVFEGRLARFYSRVQKIFF
jgi:hypothetical protein